MPADCTACQSGRRVTRRPRFFAPAGVSASSTHFTSSALRVFSAW